MADIVIINPRFEISFWGMEHCMRMFGKRANLPVACLALLAALRPGPSPGDAARRECRRHRFRALRPRRPCRHDRNEHSGWRMIEILEELKSTRGHDRRRRADGDRRAGGLLRKGWPTSSSSARPTRPGRNSCANGSRAVTSAATSRPRRPTDDVAATPRFDLLKMRPLHVRQPADFPRLSVHVRVLRHHRHLRPEAAAQDHRAGPRPSSKHSCAPG